jgi:RNA polymerase sigma-70 factor (ECF subfamily)
LHTTFDAGWRRRALAGHADAVAALAEAVLQPLYAFCFYRVGRNRHLCEEVVQETLVRAIRDLRSYDPSRSQNHIFPWITGLARNEIHRALAREKPALSLETLWARLDEDLRAVYGQPESEPLGDDVLARAETRELVNATMSQLPPHYREALEAKYVRGQSVRDMAAGARTSEKAVESQLTRARQAFREIFLALTRNLDTELA